MYLKKDFRNVLFSKAYENSGQSLCSIALELGYSGSGRNGIVRKMWLGTAGIPPNKIEKIAKIAGLSITEVSKNTVSKEENIEIGDWMAAFRQYTEKKVRP